LRNLIFLEGMMFSYSKAVLRLVGAERVRVTVG
jgi:hypothetical protein